MGRTNTFVPDLFGFFTLNETRNRNSDCAEARQEKTREDEKACPVEYKYNLASAHQSSFHMKIK